MLFRDKLLNERMIILYFDGSRPPPPNHFIWISPPPIKTIGNPIFSTGADLYASAL